MPTTITGNVKSLSTAAITSGAFLRLWLRGTRGNQPRVTGTGAIAPQFNGNSWYIDLTADGTGAIAGTVYSTRDAAGTGNGEIEAGGSYTAVWYGMQLFNNNTPGPEVPIHAKLGTTLDISNVTPISTIPVITAPTGDQTYVRNDGGNGPVMSMTVRRFENDYYVDQYGGLQAAITAALANGGGRVKIPANFTATLTGTGVGEWSLLTVGNNLTIEGDDRNTSAIKVGDGTMTSGADFPNIIFYSNGTTPISNLSVRNLTVNFNGANNLEPVAHPSKRMAFFYAPYAQDCLFENITFLNNPGTQTIAVGNNTAPQTSQRIRVKGCVFHNFGPGVSGNVNSIDHSAVYLQADDSEVSGNLFYNDSYPTGGTGIEAHCRNSRIANNEMLNCLQGMNLVATVTDFTNNVVFGNVLKSVGYGFRVYVQNGRVWKDGRIINNVVSLANTSNYGGCYVGLTDATSSPQGLVFSGNTVSQEGTLTGTSNIAAGIYALFGVDLIIEGNHFHELSGRGVDVATTCDRIAINHNTIWDTGQGGHSGPYTQGIAVQTVGTINRCTITNNSIYNVNVANYITEGIKLSGTVNTIGDLGSNKIANDVTSRLQLSGWTGTLSWAAYADQQDGHWYVKDITNASLPRIELVPNNATNLNAGNGVNATNFNMTANSGSGGYNFGSGGGSPSVVAAISATGLGAFNGGVKVASGGTTLTQVIVYAPSLTPASVAAATIAEQTFTVTGLTTADKVMINPPSMATSTGIAGVRVSASNTIAIRFVNPTAGALTPDAGTYTVIAFRS